MELFDYNHEAVMAEIIIHRDSEILNLRRELHDLKENIKNQQKPQKEKS